MNSAARFARGLGALGVIVAVVVGVPALLVALGLVPDGLPTMGDVVSTLRARDDGQLLVGVLAAGAWLCWLLFTLATAAELWALRTARPALRIPGMRVVQGSVAVLVATAVLGLSLSATAGSASASPSADRPPLPVATAAVADVAPVTAGPRAVPGRILDENPAYVVQRRDTLWGLAEQHLGDPLRYPEIVALNDGAVGPDNRITPGTTLLFPHDAVGLAEVDDTSGASQDSVVEVVVQPGDSLWSITQEVTGDGDSWPSVWEANEGRAEPGGEVVSDPDLLRPGWTLTVPGTGEVSGTASTHDTAPVPQPAPSAPTPATPPSPSTSVPSPTASTMPSPSGSATPSPAPAGSGGTEPSAVGSVGSDDDSATSHDGHDAAPVVAVVGMASALGAVSLLALRRYRRRQFRHRRPGTLLPPVPAELAAAERKLAAQGGVDLAWLDETLRGLAPCPSQGPVPDVIAVGMSADVMTVVLAEPIREAPTPWVADEAGTRWTLARTVESTDGSAGAERGHAPFPALVALGRTTSGQHWFIDLERAGVLTVTGDQDRAADLLRYIAAELAHNPWSDMLTVAAVGLGQELAPLNPDRLELSDSAELPVSRFRRWTEERAGALCEQSVDALQARVRDLQSDAWDPRVLILGPGHAACAASLAGVLKGEDRRAGLGMVVADDEFSAGVRIDMDASGTLIIPELGLELVAHQLPVEEAAQLAQLLAHVADISEPTDAGTASAPGAQELPTAPAEARHEVVEGLVDSVLPLPDASYLVDAATTIEDVHTLAPAATDTGRQRAMEQDRHLDRDLADWRDPECHRPKLTLLGPVRVDAAGRLPDRNPRRQFYTEVVAYLATRPDGATSEQYATALWPDEPDVIGKTKVRQSISVVRAWLGAEADGADFLPSGLSTAAAGRYRITGALVDADLFRRLRSRGVARGADGVVDLERALDLVTGRPFELPDLRVRGVGGYGWLLDDGSRMDLELAALVVDVAHVVATHHLGNGEPDRAAAAAHIALRSGTYEDVPLLDLVAACDAMGNRAEADAYVARILANHDAEVEEDLPPRTALILFRREQR